ncbi:hypothetical protein AVEN_188051-1 [Araneus ventricosus]|nr:hypothetical protein AVEN_108734-1 [Araneus ventricosus]GBN38894.1 hypothetical protein AVEN_188051-1 [Araneus ventricosus]
MTLCPSATVSELNRPLALIEQELKILLFVKSLEIFAIYWKGAHFLRLTDTFDRICVCRRFSYSHRRSRNEILLVPCDRNANNKLIGSHFPVNCRYLHGQRTRSLLANLPSPSHERHAASSQACLPDRKSREAERLIIINKF